MLSVDDTGFVVYSLLYNQVSLGPQFTQNVFNNSNLIIFFVVDNLKIQHFEFPEDFLKGFRLTVETLMAGKLTKSIN